MDARLKEAAKLGFRRALAPAEAEGGAGMAPIGTNRLAEAVRRVNDGIWD
jgi:DNA repair protein RadA/Sms